MAIRSILSTQTDFTGEFPITPQTSAMWRFNEPSPDGNTRLMDGSGHGRRLTISGWSGTTASLVDGRHGRYLRINRNDPVTEKTYLTAVNDDGFFSNPGDKIAVGGWINPTSYAIGAQYSPIFNTRQGPGQPLFYLSLISGKPRMMLYNASGSLLLDQSESPPFSLVNNGWYFLGAIIGVAKKTSQMIVCDRSSDTSWIAPERAYTGDLNSSCVADIVLGMHANQYYYAGGLDDWFFEMDTRLAIEDLARYFRQSMLTNGGDTSGTVDALAEPGGGYTPEKQWRLSRYRRAGDDRRSMFAGRGGTRRGHVGIYGGYDGDQSGGDIDF